MQRMRFAWCGLLTRRLLQTSIYILLVARPEQVSVPSYQCATDRAKCSCRVVVRIEKLILTLPVHSKELADDLVRASPVVASSYRAARGKVQRQTKVQRSLKIFNCFINARDANQY